MNVHLMYPDRDFDLNASLPAHAETVSMDLELDTVCQAMASGDDFLFEVARKALLSAPGNDERNVRYRQQVLHDCLNRPGRCENSMMPYWKRWIWSAARCVSGASATRRKACCIVASS